jgi:hypothetical protein
VGGLPDWGIIYRMVKYRESFEQALNSAHSEYVKKKKRNLFIRLGERLEGGNG